MIDNLEIKYSVGALLYCPAINNKIADSVINEKFEQKYSLALCLEDTIAEEYVKAAEKQLKDSLEKIYLAAAKKKFYMPQIFIRVRNPYQLEQIFAQLKKMQRIISGFIFPKYSVENADQYNLLIEKINRESESAIYMMPILESKDIIDLFSRRTVLYQIKEKIDAVKPYVLNVRVGGNDFSNEFAVRRHYDETIYDILSISQILGDILTVFSGDYVISGPVWEFFSSEKDEWRMGLKEELKRDRMSGFIGKTVIHPKQIEVVNESLKVSRKDYEDALNILHWGEGKVQVGKSFAGERMNEVKTHYNWAVKIMTLAKIYGVL